MPGAAIRAGDLRDRFIFARCALDDNGDRLGEWGADAITVAANVQYLHGTETVQAQRLQGVQPVILTIRISTAARLIDNAFEAVDTRDWTRVFDITGVEPTPDRAFLQVLATTKKGQASG